MNIKQLWPYAYITFINLYGFLLMCFDKRRAEKHESRVPEKNLMITGVIGGSIGVLMAMISCKHKLSKDKFYKGIPLIICAQWMLFVLINISYNI